MHENLFVIAGGRESFNIDPTASRVRLIGTFGNNNNKEKKKREKAGAIHQFSFGAVPFSLFCCYASSNSHIRDMF